MKVRYSEAAPALSDVSRKAVLISETVAFGAADESHGHHVTLASHCFEHAEQLLRRPWRSAQEDTHMAAFVAGAVFHAFRADSQSSLLQVASAWLASRAAFALGHGNACLRYAEICARASEGGASILQGYAADAMSRAHRLLENVGDAARFAAIGKDIADKLQPTGRSVLHDELLN